jgi:UTP--glucose-1-phosphate uridylyltransferase
VNGKLHYRFGKRFITAFCSRQRLWYETIRNGSKIRKAVFPPVWVRVFCLPKASPKRCALVDKPLIQYVVEEAVQSGIDSVIVLARQNCDRDHFDVAELELYCANVKLAIWELRQISESPDELYPPEEALGLDTRSSGAGSVKTGPSPCCSATTLSIPGSALQQVIDVYEKYDAPVVATSASGEEISIRRVMAKRLATVCSRQDRSKPAVADAPSDTPALVSLRIF